MATITWTGKAGDNNWSNPANWSPAQVPGANDTAVISPAAATAIGVGGITVGAVTDSANVTLTVANNSNFTLGAGGTNSATTFTNGGTLALAAAGNLANVIFADTTTTLTGGGTVLLSDSVNNRIYAASASDTLTNVNNTIAGAGQLGANQLTFVNQKAGVVDATSATNALTLQTSAPVLNSGLLESTGAGGLVIQSTTVNQTGGGTISASGAGAVVVLNGATIQGGTLATAKGGLIETGSSGGALDGTLVQVVNAGTLAVQNATSLGLAGTIDNTGTITENAGVNTTNIILTGPVTTLTGGGTILLSNSANNRIYGQNQGYALNNVNNTIAGAGQLGAGQIVINNEAKGVIDANQATGLVLDTANAVTNTGLIEATGTGGLQIQNSNIVNAGGTVSATGAGAHVDLNGGTIEGGTVAASKGGVVDVVSTGGLDGASHGALTLSGSFVVENNTTLSLAGVISNGGTIAEDAGVNTTRIALASAGVTLTGGGALTLSNSDANYVYGNSALDVLVNVNNVISGTGNLGDGQMTLINESGGTIDATNAAIQNVSSGVLTLDCNGGITNAGLIEDTGTAGLVVLNSLVNNAGGTIRASGTGALVTINGSTIEGGTLSGTGGGIAYLVNSATLDGGEAGIGAVTLAGNVQLSNGQVAYLAGTIDNTGTLTLNSAGNTTELRLASSSVTLAGGGALVFSANANNYIFGNAGIDQLVNLNNTISGAGDLGDGQMVLVNAAAGVIDGNSTVGLTLNCNFGATNLGLIEATAGGVLTVSNTLLNNAGGTLLASGANSGLYLAASTIEGGTLATAAGGVIYAENNTSLDGSEAGIGALTNTGSVQVVNGNVAYLDGTIANSGTINIDSIGSTTELRLGTETVTLTGGGSILLSDNANNYIFGNSGYFTLNNAGNTIAGAGQLGDGQMQLVNTGTVDATGSNALVLNAGSYDVSNGAGGLIEATATGGLSFTTGIFSNAGTVAALGGNVTFGTGVANLNALAGTLTGGAWSAASGGTLAITGGPIVVDAAALSLQGANSLIEAGNGSTFTALGASLTSIAAGGSLFLGPQGALAVAAANLTDAGGITLAGGTLTAKTITLTAGATLAGLGSVKGAVADAGTVNATGSGTLAISGALSGKGSLQIGNNATTSVGGKLTVAAVNFAAGGTETLALASPAGATSVISGFAHGDVIDLTKTAATALSYSGNTSSGVLTVKNGTTVVATFNFSGNYTTASFALAPLGSGVTITETGSAPALPEGAADFPHPLAASGWLPAAQSHAGGFADMAHVAGDPFAGVLLGHLGW